jgi:hypothetical protein
VKFSKGTLRVQTGAATSNTNHITFSEVNALGGRTLDKINLAIRGEEFAFDGVNISMVAKPQVLITGEVLGDGKANVGSLVAATLNADLFQISSGIALGKVSIPGNLGELIAGATRRIAGARSIEVDSFGADSTTGSLVLGPIGKMIVKGDFMGNLLVIGDAESSQPLPGGGVGKIGNLVIGGVLKGGTNPGSGRIAFTGGIGSATIGGIEGGAGNSSATLASISNGYSTRIGSLTVLGDIAGGSGPNSGLVEADQIGSLTVGKAGKTAAQRIQGSIVGGSGDLSGVVSANTYGNVTINGDLRGGGGDTSGYLVANIGFGDVRISGSIVGGAGESSGFLAAGFSQNNTTFAANAKSITIGSPSDNESGNLTGGSGKESGRIRITGNVTKFLAYGDIVGGKGAGSGGLFVGGNSFTIGLLQSAVIKGSILGGSTDATSVVGGVTSLFGSGYVQSDRIGAITVEGRIESGTNNGSALAQSGAIYAADSIGSLKVGSVKGNAGVPVVISALRSIGSAAFGLDVTHLELLAGYTAPEAGKPRGVLRDAGAFIDSVVVKGTFTASSIAAGVHAGNDGQFGTADDTEGAAGSAQNQGLISRIASVVLNQVGVPTDGAAGASYGIVAEHVKSLKIGGQAVPLEAGPSEDGPLPIGPAGSKLQVSEI